MYEERHDRRPAETPAEAPSETMGPLFPLGTVLATPGAIRALERAGESSFRLLGRHSLGDWGELDDEDRRANDEALRSDGRLLSAYRLEGGEKLWVITEWDRSATTLLLPSEY